jgi:hypothetical protein
VISANSLFTFLTQQPQVAMCCLNYTEANVNECGIAFGFASSWTHILADTTYALPTSLSGALIYKQPGSLNWNVWGSVGTTQSNQQITTLSQAAALPQQLIINAMMDVAGNVELTFAVGPVGTGNSGVLPAMPSVTNMARMQQTKFIIPYASAAAMQLGCFVKAGSSSSEVVNLDCIGAEILSVP